MQNIELENFEKNPGNQFDSYNTEPYHHDPRIYTLSRMDKPSAPPSNQEIQAEDRNYWLKQIRFACIPLLIIGFPVHLLYRDDSFRDARPLTIIRPYLYPRMVLFQTAMLIVLPLSIIGYLSYHTWQVIYYLLVIGELEWDLFIHGCNLARTLPAALPLLACWFRGPCIAEFISSFDLLRRDFFNSLRTLKLRNRPVIHPRPTGNGYLKRTFFIYFLITVTLIIPVIVDSWVRRTAIGYWITTVYSFMLPVYCVLCWAVFEEYKTLSRYLKSLMANDGIGPTLENLAQIKAWYRKIGRHVIYINYTIGYYMCWVLPTMMFAICVHITFLMAYFMGYGSVKGFFFFQDLLLEGETQDSGTPQELFRKSVAHTFVALLRLAIIAYTVKQAVDVNDEARFTHILLNEYLNDHSTWIIQNDDLYKASRHLKTYMYVTHEKYNPAFMRLLVVEYCPIIAGRLHKQNQRDVIAHGRFLQEVV